MMKNAFMYQDKVPQNTELHEQFLKQMDDESLLSLIKKEMEKSESERKKLQQ